VLGCAGGAVALANSHDVHGAGVTVPDLTGLWRNVNDPSSAPAWQLTASNGRQTLDATWRGSTATGHPDLRGTFHTTLTQSNVYTGRYHVTEDAVTSDGDMTVKVDSANQIEFTLQPDGGGAAQNYTFRRVGNAPPSIGVARTPAFDLFGTVAAPPPGGEAVDASPQLGNATDVTATETGVSPDDVAFYAAAVIQIARHLCYLEAFRNLASSVRGAKPGTVDTLTYIRALEEGGADVFLDVAACMASADTIGNVLDSLIATTPAAAAQQAASACRTTPVTLTVRSRRVRKLSVGGIKGVSVRCTLNSGTLKLRVHSKSGKPLRKLVGKRLFVGVRRSKHDSAGGQMGFMFHKG
jgi:hypothetical protein